MHAEHVRPCLFGCFDGSRCERLISKDVLFNDGISMCFFATGPLRESVVRMKNETRSPRINYERFANRFCNRRKPKSAHPVTARIVDGSGTGETDPEN
jgi:hypothetical protein